MVNCLALFNTQRLAEVSLLATMVAVMRIVGDAVVAVWGGAGMAVFVVSA